VAELPASSSAPIPAPEPHRLVRKVDPHPFVPSDPAVLGAKGSLFLTRPGLNQYIATREELVARADDLFAWLAAGKLKLTIDRVRPLAEAAEAHRDLEARRTAGKLLLVP